MKTSFGKRKMFQRRQKLVSWSWFVFFNEILQFIFARLEENFVKQFLRVLRHFWPKKMFKSFKGPENDSAWKALRTQTNHVFAMGAHPIPQGPLCGP